MPSRCPFIGGLRAVKLEGALHRHAARMSSRGRLAVQVLMALARGPTLNACAALSYNGVAVSQSAFILNATIDGFSSCSALSKSSLPFCLMV